MRNTRLSTLSRLGMLSFAEEPDATEGGSTETDSPDTTDQVDETTDESAADEDEPLREPGVKALKQERKRASEEKRRADAAEARLKEIADAEKTELQRAQERIAELEKTTQAYEAEKQRSEMRAKVLDAKNVPSEWADFVTGDSEDEMNASADKILRNLGTGQGPNLPPTSGQAGGSLEAGVSASRQYFRG